MTAVNDDILATENGITSGNVFVDNGNGADVDTNPDISDDEIGDFPGQAVTAAYFGESSVVLDVPFTIGGDATLTVNTSGNFTFDPGTFYDYLNVGESTTVSFTYVDDEGESASVTIKIQGSNDVTLDLSLPVHLFDDQALVGTFSTIQAAIDAAGASDTIIIGAGVYTEQLTVAGKDGLTIRAADNADVTVKAPADLSVNGISQHFGDNVRAVIAVNDSFNVVIEGIEVDGSFAGDTTTGGNGDEFTGIAFLRSSGGADGVNVFGVSNSPTAPIALFGLQHGSGILIDGQGAGTVPAVFLTDSTVSDFQKTGILAGDATLTLTGNTVSGIGATNLIGQNGLQVFDASGTISGNTINGLGYSAPVGDETYASAIIAYEPTGLLTIDGNIITGAGGGSQTAGIDVSDTSTGSVAITNNAFSGLQYGVSAYTYSGGSLGLDGFAAFDGNTFADISINGVYFSPELSYGAPYSTSQNLVINGSSVVDFLAGSNGDDTIDGGAGADEINGAAGNDRIVFDAADTVDGGEGTDTLIVADAAEAAAAAASATGIELISDGDGTFYVFEGMSIQAAIDAAKEGNSIIIGAGTFAEQLLIDGKDISISGQGDATIIEAPVGTIAYQAGAAGNRASIITVVNADNVSIDDLRIDGEGRGNEIQAGYSDFHGVAFINAGGSVDDVTVTGIRAPLDENGNVSGGQQGRAIYANNVDGNARSLTVSDSTVSDFQKNGIDLRGTGLTVTVSSNVVTGNGATPTNAQNGIVVLGAAGTVSGNTVSEVGYVDTPTNAAASSAGILSFNSSGVVISDNILIAPTGTVSAPNTLSAAGVSSFNDSNGIDVSNNEISGFTFGVLSDDDGAAPNHFGNVFTGNDVNLQVQDLTAASSFDGTDGIDNLEGSEFNDSIDGGLGADTINAGAGDDDIFADASDIIDGGSGTDTVFVRGAADAAAVAANSTNVELIRDKGTFYVFEGMSIQAAIDAAREGDTIILAAGTYGEDLIVSEGVTLRGANVGVDGTGTRGAESVLTGQIDVTAASAVTIDGVTVSYDGTESGIYSAVYLQTAGHTVTNSRFLTTVPTGAADTRAILMGPQASGSFTVSDNYFGGAHTGNGSFGAGANTASWNRGVWSDGGGVTLTVTGNTFEHNRTGINLDGFSNATSNVSGNTFLSSGSGISVGTAVDASPIDAISRNNFTAVGTDFNLRNLTTDIDFSAAETGNVATDTLTILGGTAGDELSGTEGADVIDAENLSTDTANPDADTLFGLGGDDILLGKDGDDLLNGGAGTDSLDGGTGFDTADYSDQSDAITVNLVAGTVTGDMRVGTDTLTSIEAVRGGSGNDIVNGGAGFDATGFAVDAVLTNASFTLNADNSWTVTGDGTDTINGGEVVYDSTGAAFLLVGGNSFPTIAAALASGIEGTIVLGTLPTATPEDPEPVVLDLTGGGVDVEITGSTGFDTLDIQTTDTATVIITVLQNIIGVTVDDLGDESNIQVFGVEELLLNGQSVTIAGDFSGTGLAQDTIIYTGTAGNDEFDGSGVIGANIEASGLAGNDTLLTGDGDDLVDGGEGSDTVDAGAGDDLVIGNIDGVNDVYDGELGVDTIDYSADTDGINLNLTSASASGAGIGNDVASGFENAIGGSGGDSLIGNGADNRLTGGLGDDDIRGLNGVDTVVINAVAATGIATQLGGGRLSLDTADGSDIVRTVEFLEFTNATIAVNTTTGNAHAFGVADTDVANEGASGAGTPATGNVLDDDFDIEALDTISVAAVAAGNEAANTGLTTGGVGGAIQGAYGALTLNANGTYSYVVNNESLAANETAIDTFTYRVSDQQGDGDLTTITFTVSGENDAPVISAADGPAAVTEAATTVSDTGAIVFSDLDLTNDLTVTEDSATTTVTWDGGSLSMGQEAALRAGFTLDATSFDNSGTVNWTYSASAADLDFLAAGETVSFDVTVTVTDNSGQMDNSDSTIVTVTITGTNDGPTIDSADGVGAIADGGTLSDTGAIAFSDLDQTDTLDVTDNAATTATISWTGGTLSNDQEAALRAGFSLDGAGFGNDGTVNWTYAVGQSDLDFLSGGESVTFTVTVTVTDEAGVTATQDVVITIDGANNPPTVAGALTDSVDEDTASYGRNLLDGAADADQNAELSIEKDMEGAPDVSVEVTTGTWVPAIVYSVDAAGELTLDPDQFNELGVSESLELTFSYTILDGAGGSVAQTLTLTVTGSNDGPIVESALSNTVDEDGFPVEENLLSGSFDSDRDENGLFVTDGTTTGVSVAVTAGTWVPEINYSVDAEGVLTLDPNQFDALGHTESVELTFSYMIEDETGAQVAQTYTLTVTGENDAPVVAAALTDTADEDDAVVTQNLLDGASDADRDEDGLFVIEGTTDGVRLEVTSGTWDEPIIYSVDANGVLSLDPDQFDALGDTESLELTFSYAIGDEQEAGVRQTYTLTVTGSNDGPVVEAALTDTVDEDDAMLTQNLLAGSRDDDRDEDGLFVTDGETTGVSVAVTTGTWMPAITYSVDVAGVLSLDPDQFDALGATESLELTFSYMIEDETGAQVAQTYILSVDGSNDRPTVAASLTDTANEDDASFSLDLLDGAADDDRDAVLSVINDSVLQTGGTAFNLTGFDYDIDADGNLTFDPDQFDTLGADDDIALTFSYTVTDENNATVSQTAVITIQGENDDLEFIDPNAAPAAFGENDTLRALGGFDFEGADRTDTPTASASLTSATVSGGGSLTMAQQNALAAAMSTSINGSIVDWVFNVSAPDFNSLNPGQNVTATYTVTVDDGNGGSDTRTVTVTINGDFENQTAPDGGGTVTGTNLADNITGSTDDDAVNAGGGNNVVNAGSGDDSVTAGSGNDIINGGSGDDTIVSGSGNDTLNGGEGDDDINAGSGNDTVVSSAGDDIVRGGSGTDTLSFANTSAGVLMSLAFTGGQVTADGTDFYSGFENVIGSDFADTITGNDAANELRGGLGADTLTGGLGADLLIGGLGNDTYFTDSLDTIVELANEGTDRIFTSAATFDISSVANIENVFGQATTGQTITGNDVANTLSGSTGADRLDGGLGADTLLGGGGNDTLIGGSGAANTLQGGAGDDIYVVTAGDSIVELANEGTDTVQTFRASQTLGNNVENLTFVGTGNFIGVGNTLANVITGGTGTDDLVGGGGNDTLIGGSGSANTLQGGAGDDIYVVTANDSIIELANDGTDTVQTSRASQTLGNNVENLTFVGTGNFTGTGNALANVIIGGSGNDTLMGAAGNDTINGGLGTDIARLSGVAAGYSIAVEGAGYRVIDTNLADGNDGSDFLTNIETLLFGNGSTMTLVAPASAPLPSSKDFNDFEVLPGSNDKVSEFDVIQILPSLADSEFFMAKAGDMPLVLPAADTFGEALFGSLGAQRSSFGDNVLVRDGFMVEMLPDDAILTNRNDEWML